MIKLLINLQNYLTNRIFFQLYASKSRMEVYILKKELILLEYLSNKFSMRHFYIILINHSILHSCINLYMP